MQPCSAHPAVAAGVLVTGGRCGPLVVRPGVEPASPTDAGGAAPCELRDRAAQGWAAAVSGECCGGLAWITLDEGDHVLVMTSVLAGG